MAEAVPFGIVTNILTKLGSSAFLKISSVYGVKKDMRKLESTISSIKVALVDADQRQENSNSVRDWIKELNYVVHDADDVMDEISTKALQHELYSTDRRVLNMQQVREFFSTSNSLAFRYEMRKKIKEIRERLDGLIAANMSNFKFKPETVLVEARTGYNERETDSFVLMSEVVGRDKEKEEIIQLIMCSDNQKENVSVIPIVGMGGLGKTTLAQLINKDERVVEYFELRIWVCVSEDFETESLVMKILKSLTNEVVAGDLDLEQLQSQVRQKLDGKRYLLMLDDVWNETSEKWVGVRSLLMGGAKGSSVVVTTRSKIVASVMGVEHPYVLEGLSEEKSWTLFEKIAFRGHEKKMNLKLKVIGKEIVKRCKGVPLAIRSLAGVVQLKTKESEWLFIQNSDIWRDDADILPILKLSYDHLPSYLKQCFAYCAIFPKDHEIEKEFLIQLWMAQGYVQSPDASQYLEEIGNQYFRDLLSRSFFKEARVDDGILISSKMHDLIHDLAMRVAGFDCFIVDNCCIVDKSANNISESVRHVLFRGKVPTQLMKAKGLRTLLGRDSLDIYTKFRCLRVLDVSDCHVKNVPKLIGNLQHLRYLDLSGNDMINLPNSIRTLVNLQTLKLSRCDDLKRLTEGITKLINLRYLETDGCRSLEYMPMGMGKLTSLRRLTKLLVGGNNTRSVRLCELNELNELRGDISLEELENVEDGRWEAKEANLMAKKYLHSLTLKWGLGFKTRIGGSSSISKICGNGNMDEILLEGLQPHPGLRVFEIHQYCAVMFPCWMMMGNIVSSLPNIVRITLDVALFCEHVPTSLDQLPFLKFLKLRMLLEVEHINDDNINNHRVGRKSSTEGMSVFFPSLEGLVIEHLPRLKGWWRAAAESETSSMTVEEEEREREESSQRPSFPRLTKLTIMNCPKLISMPIHSSHHLETTVLDRVPEKLVRQLLRLTTTEAIQEEGSVASSSSSSSSSIPSPLSSKLNLLNIIYLPPGEEGLWKLYAFDKISTLSIPNLVSFPVWLQQLTTQHLLISHSPGLMALPEQLSNLTSLQSFHIRGCPLLSERCQKETGEDWSIISHIPNISIDSKFIQGIWGDL